MIVVLLSHSLSNWTFVLSGDNDDQHNRKVVYKNNKRKTGLLKNSEDEDELIDTVLMMTTILTETFIKCLLLRLHWPSLLL